MVKLFQLQPLKFTLNPRNSQVSKGHRIVDIFSPHYSLLLSWIQQGLPVKLTVLGSKPFLTIREEKSTVYYCFASQLVCQQLPKRLCDIQTWANLGKKRLCGWKSKSFKQQSLETNESFEATRIVFFCNWSNSEVQSEAENRSLVKDKKSTRQRRKF